MAEETKIEKILYQGNDQFTAKMLSEVVKENENQSFVLSAFSILQPLAQLGLASLGQSHDEILKTIGIPNDDVTKEVFPLVNDKLRSVKGIELKMANKVFIPEGRTLNHEFSVVSKAVFGSEVENVNFGNSQKTVKHINTWVEDQTNHRIKDLVPVEAINSGTRAVLVNAIYFKGTWKSKFDSQLTVGHNFHVSREKISRWPFMFRKGQYNYGESIKLNAKLLELPYLGDESSFLIVLPNEIDGINALEQKLKDLSIVDKAVENMNIVNVNVFLPKFIIETTTSLKQVLYNTGIQRLFLPGQAQLDKLLSGENELYISNAIQKAFIEINEEGAEAAVANDV